MGAKRNPAVRTQDETGAIGGVEGMAFGVLVFVFGTLLFATAWGVMDAKLATGAAAREAARAFVEAANEGQAMTSASDAADSTMNGYGRPVHELHISGAFARCQPVEVVVSTRVPKIAIPALRVEAGRYTVVGRHREIVDPYRSGLSGTASCIP